MQNLHFLAEITTAMLLGAAIGVERQWRQRLAGLRTNALVALGAAAFVELAGLGTDGAPLTERMRIAAQVVSGIGFIGGGGLENGMNAITWPAHQHSEGA